ncbi:universal stress protein [Streptomyces sp. NPDC004783]|uniref:universal stress protein n=1 Tax=Streptomyces sp. NPDC004783 TaxID=3154459 RepID=UPI0033BFAC75
MTRPVVAGVDGSPSSRKAVGFAAHEAALRGAELRLVHAFGGAVPHVTPGAPRRHPGAAGTRELVDGTLTEAERLAHRVAPRVEVSREVTVGEPLTVLEIASRTASLVVVGNRGLSTFGSLLLGSTAGHLAAHARCPVLVVRGRDDPDGPVLVAVDEGSASAAAVGFAFAEASLRRADLLAAHVTGEGDPDAYDGPADPPFVTRDERRLRANAEHVIDAALAGARDRYPDVPVRRLPLVGHVRRSLIDASADAQLMVVGARGRGGFPGLLLGSVGHALLHHARCPLVVVRVAPAASG